MGAQRGGSLKGWLRRTWGGYLLKGDWEDFCWAPKASSRGLHRRWKSVASVSFFVGSGFRVRSDLRALNLHLKSSEYISGERNMDLIRWL